MLILQYAIAELMARGEGMSSKHNYIILEVLLLRSPDREEMAGGP